MPVKVVSFKVDDELMTMLELVARRTKKSKSEIVRAALRRYLLEESERKPVITARVRIWG